MRLDRAAIETLVPQRGDMCLLDKVLDWDESRIACSAAAPSPTHPLAREGVIHSVVACEYAAQAAAVHGGLLAPSDTAVEGLLAKVTDVELLAMALPGDEGPLTVNAHVMSRLASGCLYSFDVQAAGVRLATGKVMIAFERPA
jgi:predicted hotdog family 3-hydroxylacyl-ACP dehydratase